MKLKKRYDVVIVGSGPSGASTAKALTDSGLETMIIEKCKLPRYKMCSGILFPSAYKFISKNFGSVPQEVLSKPNDFKGLRVFLTLDSPYVEAPGSVLADEPDLPEFGLNIKRPELDYWLCSMSDASIIDNCKFVGFRQKEEELILKVRYADKDLELSTRYLVGADGSNSRVRGTVSPDFYSGLRLIPNYEEWYVGKIDLEPGWLYIFFDRKLTGFMATVFHKDNELTVVTGARKGESAKQYFKKFVKYLERKHGLIIEKRTKHHGIVLNDMSATNNYILGSENILIVGEAAGFLRSAEGITSALITGRAAGESILKSIEFEQPALDFYSEAVVSEMEACEKAHQLVESFAGYNMFTRE